MPRSTSDSVRHFLVFGDRDENAPEMIAEGSFVPVADLLERVDIKFLVSHFPQSAAGEIGLAADESEETGAPGLIRQRRTITVIEVRDLLEREITEFKARSHIERRLIHVGDEQVRLGGVNDRQGELEPWAYSV